MNAIEKSPKEFASPRSLTISKNFFVELIGALSLFLVYELVYIFIEYPIFSYVGYTFSFNYWRFVLAAIS